MTMVIRRGETAAFTGAVPLSQLRRSVTELMAYLRRDNPVPDGTVLMTGTGIVPPAEFTLQPGDVVEIGVEDIGVLVNPIAAPSSAASVSPQPSHERPSRGCSF